MHRKITRAANDAVTVDTDAQLLCQHIEVASKWCLPASGRATVPESVSTNSTNQPRAATKARRCGRNGDEALIVAAMKRKLSRTPLRQLLPPPRVFGRNCLAFCLATKPARWEKSAALFQTDADPAAVRLSSMGTWD